MKLHKYLNNLTYVSIDRDTARNHWWTMVHALGTCHAEHPGNHRLFVAQKAVAGICGHVMSRKFRMHTVRERMLTRRLARKARWNAQKEAA